MSILHTYKMTDSKYEQFLKDNDYDIPEEERKLEFRLKCIDDDITELEEQKAMLNDKLEELRLKRLE